MEMNERGDHNTPARSSYWSQTMLKEADSQEEMDVGEEGDNREGPGLYMCGGRAAGSRRRDRAARMNTRPLMTAPEIAGEVKF